MIWWVTAWKLFHEKVREFFDFLDSETVSGEANKKVEVITNYDDYSKSKKNNKRQ